MRAWHLLFVLAALSCRKAPGDSNYGAQEVFHFRAFLSAPDPYQPGQKRLDVGAFYEGGFSDEAPIDDTTSHLYIYPNGDSVTIAEDTVERIEGISSDRVVYQGLGWWGFGIHWTPARDMSGWTKMHVALRSSDPTFADVNVGMNNDVPFTVLASQYGYVHDGTWHLLIIPLSAFGGLNVAAVQAPFVLGSPAAIAAGQKGDALGVDDLYFSQD